MILKQEQLRRRMQMAAHWLLCSGIQIANRSPGTRGGIYAWYDNFKKRYSFLYPEITGYGITAYLYVSRELGLHARQQAEMAAQWAQKNALHKSGGVRVRTLRVDPGLCNVFISPHLLYSFDSGMVLYGLTSLYKTTHKKKYLTIAKRIARFLIAQQRADGSMNPIVDTQSAKNINTNLKWSTQSGSYLAKCAIGLIDLFDITGEKAYRKCILRLCKHAMEKQEPNGRFITSTSDKSTHLHPHSYTAEGLLYVGKYLNKRSFVHSARKATLWALSTQLGNGGIPTLVLKRRTIAYERSDILAQTLRLGTIFMDKKMLPARYKKSLHRLALRLCSFQRTGIDEKLRGGFLYGTEASGLRRENVNAWCTMFAMQALSVYRQLLERPSKTRISCDLLI